MCNHVITVYLAYNFYCFCIKGYKMDIKKQYINALKNGQYNELAGLLINNIIGDFGYKSICDLGTYLCDVDDDGLRLELTSDECNHLGIKLIEYSFYNYPNETNAFALQYAYLEKSNNYTNVIRMRNNLEVLNNCMLLNNLSTAYFNLGLYDEAFSVQLHAFEMIKTSNINDVENNIIIYNLLLYKLFNNMEIDNRDESLNHILSFIISEEMYDYPCAIALAMYFDYRCFVINNQNTLLKTFIVKEDLLQMINDYVNHNIRPEFEKIKDYLFTQTYYESGFYLIIKDMV